MPPLRERAGEAALLANFFLRKFAAQFGRRIRGYTAEAISAIASYRWPGNVRELENRVKRAVIMSDGRLISASDLELAPAADGNDLDIRTARLRAEREVVQKALSQSNGTISTAAKLLGISRPTLYALLETHGLATASESRLVSGVADAVRLKRRSVEDVGKERSMAARTLTVPALLLSLAASAGAAWANDYLDDANRLIAAGDLRAAEIQLKNAVRTEPKNMTGHYRLGSVYLELGEGVAAEHEARVARDGGYDADSATVLLARAMLAEGKYREVLQQFAADAGNPEQRAQVLVLRGYAQLALDRSADAKESFTEAQRLAPRSAEVVLAQAKLMVRSGHLEAAKAAFDQALALAPQAPEALLGKASLLRRQGDPQGALHLLDGAVKANPQQPRLRLARAEILLDLDDKQRAATDIAAVLGEQPNNAIAIYLSAILHAKQAKFHEADADLDRLSPVLNRLPRGYYVLAVVKSNLGQLSQAEDAARRYAGQHPEDAAGQKLLARIALERGEPAEVVAALDKAQSAGISDDETFSLLGQADLQTGHPEKAAGAFEAAIKKAPDNPSLHYWLGVSRLQVGEARDGIEQLTRSLDLAPNVPAGALLVATDIAAGRYDAAMGIVESLQRAQPDSPMPGNLAGMVRLAEFDLAGARAAFAAVVAKQPGFVPARLNLARVAELEGKVGEARQLLERILADQPANAPALTQLVDLLLRNGKADDAVAAAERAHAAAPDSPAITSGLVDLYLRLGDKNKALAVARTEPGRNDRRDIPLIAARARAEVAAGRLTEAAQTYRRLVAVDKASIEQRRRLAAVLLSAGDAAGARATIEAAQELAPDSPQLVADRIDYRGKGRWRRGRARLGEKLCRAASRTADGSSIGRRRLDGGGRSRQSRGGVSASLQRQTVGAAGAAALPRLNRNERREGG